MKYCPMCKEDKKDNTFAKNRAKPDGLNSYCKQCSALRNKNNQKKIKAYRKKYATTEHGKRIKRESAKRYRLREVGKVAARRQAYTKRFNITVEDYNNMMAVQGNVCAMCKQKEIVIHPKTGKIQRLSVDHDHKTGEIRGLLCKNCNTALGFLGDDLDLAIEKLLNYNKWINKKDGE